MMTTLDAPRLGLAETIERLDSMPEFLDAALGAVSPEQLVARPGDGLFSLAEHACHLRDVEREAFLVRVQRLIGESAPALAPYDGGAVAARRNYLAEDVGKAARDFAAARRHLVQLLGTVRDEDLGREATFGGKPVCFADVIAMMAGHDREHREEIERLMDFLEE